MHAATLAPAQLLGGLLLDLANRSLSALSPADTVFDAARLMAAQRLSHVAVLDTQGRPLGVVTESVLLAAAHGPHGPSQGIAEVMQPALCVPHTLDAATGFQRCLAEGGAPLLLLDDDGRVVASVGEGEFRTQLQLALRAGRHRVATLMARVLRPLSPRHTLADAIDQMRSGGCTAVVVTVDEHAVGMLTSRDVARLMAAQMDVDSVVLADVMSRPVLTLPLDATLHEAAERMLGARVRHLVVLDAAGQVAGVLDEHQLTRAMAVQVMDAGIEHERLRQRAVLDAIPDLVWMKDPAGAFVICNPRCETLLGAPEARIRGKTDHDFVPAARAEALRRHDQRAIAAGAPLIDEEQLTFADGHRELVQTIKAPVRDPAGRLLGVLGIGRDITALRQAEDEYRWLFARNPAPMFLYERTNLRLLRVNEAFCHLYGYSEAQALALQLTDLYLPEDREAVRQRVARMQGLVNVGEWRHVRRDGSQVHIVAQSHDIQHDGMRCRVAVVTDVTVLKRSQQRDRQRLALMERLARGDSLPSLLEQLARDHESLFPHSLCSVLLLDEDGTRLRHGAAPSLPDFYNEALDGLAVGPGVGSCGAAVTTGQRVLAEDVEVHPNWAAYRDLARRAGLRACWSQPIVGSGSRVLGTFAVYRRTPGAPGAEELDQMQFSVQLAATAISQGGTTRALRQSERRLQDILQAIPDMVWVKDTEGIYRTCNAAFARLVGRIPERIIGAREEDFSDAADAALHRAQDEQVLRTRQALHVERWMTHRGSGQHLLTELIKTPLFDDEGLPVGVLGVARDITLIKQGAHAVAEQQRLIDTMFSQTTDSIVLVDPERLAFVNFNDAACQGLGYTREAFAQLTPRDLRADHDVDSVKALNQRAMAGEQIRFETRHRRADGQLQDAAVTLRRVSYGGRNLLSAVWRDITESKRHEARIQRLNRSYAVLSGVNEAVVRLRDRDALFAEVCRITVAAGGFGMAWVGLVDETQGQVRPVSQHGGIERHVAELRVPLDSLPLNPIAQALSAGRTGVVQDLNTLDPQAPWRDPLLAHGQRSLAVFPILPAGGQRLVLVVCSAATDHFDDEQVTLFGRLAQDVAFALEFIAADQARSEAQRFREQVIESVAGLFFALEPGGQVVLWNRRLETVSGHPHEVLATRRLEDFVDPGARALVARSLQEAVASGESQVEAALRGADGAQRPYLFVLRRLDMAQGPLVVVTGVDIADRVRSDGELARYREQLEDLVHLRTAELEAVNARLHREDRRLRAMLALSQRASGLDEQQLFRQGLDEILHLTGSAIGCVHGVRNGDPGLVLQTWTGAGPPDDTLALHVHRLGQACHVEGEQAAHLGSCAAGTTRVLGVPVIDGDQVVMVVCAADKSAPYDDADARELQLLAADLWAIVQRRRIEIALGEAKAAADAANLAKSAFLANMSHEIRTPMNAVIGFAHLLRREPLTPRQQDHLGKITDAGQHLLQVINDILDFSKIEAHKVLLEQADFSLRDSLERVRAMQLDAARAKQLPLALAVDPHCPELVRGDRLRLEQILLNLLSNAVKFTAQGRIDLRVSLLPGSGDGLRLRVEVSDTGIGMTDDQLEHVFEAFAQADASTTRRFGGTGLGLAISKRLVQLMNGQIGAHSQPGLGATFWIELPLQAARTAERGGPAGPAASAQPPAPASAWQGGRLQGVRVLVVEDNPINQEVTTTLLAALGAVVDLAASGEQALQLFDPLRHAMVLMDVQMPGMDGLRATTAIRARADGQRVPIIAMTANAFADDRAQCLAAGMNDYLAKPVDPPALESCLLRWWEVVQASGSIRAEGAGDGAASASPATGREDSLRQRLLALDSLDITAPLARMRGAWPLYLRTLRMFLSHHADDGRRLADPALTGNAQALRTLAHSLGGAAATVGAVEVLHQARALQTRLATDPAPTDADWQPLADALQRCLHQVHAALDDAQPADAPRSTAAADPAAARAALLELQPLVAAHDTAALALHERHRAVLAASLGPEAHQLAQQLDNFSFGAAQRTLAAALQRLPATAANVQRVD